jgi:hypothetical protein
MKTTSTAVPIFSRLKAIPEGPRRGRLPASGPDWIMLRNCALGGDGPRIELALLHPSVGVAFVDRVAEETNAVHRLRRALDARRFPAIFGGYPPMVRVVLPRGNAAELHRLLAAAFGAEPPPALAGGDAWIGTARAAIEAELPIVAPERRLPRRRQRRRALLWRTTALAALGSVAAAVLLAVPVLPGHGPKGPAIRSTTLVAWPTAAPSADADLFLTTATIEDDHTARDVAEALMSAELPTVAKAAYTLALPQAAPISAIVAAAVEELPEALPVRAAVQGAALAPALSDTPEAAPPEDALPGEEGTAIGVAETPESDDASAGTDLAMRTETPPRTTAKSTDAEPPGADFPPASERAPKHAAAEPPPVLPSPKHAMVSESARPAAHQTPPAASSRRTVLPASTAPPAADAGSGAGRCREILLRATMEGTLSEGDRAFLRRGCHSPRG